MLVQALIHERQPDTADQEAERDAMQAILADRRRQPEDGSDPAEACAALERTRQLNARLMALSSTEQRQQLGKDDEAGG